MAFTLYSVRLRVRTALLRFRVDQYSRELYSIGTQRKNDFEAERMLQRNLAAGRSKLRELTEDQTAAGRNSIFSPRKISRPHLVDLIRENRE
jgi:hypothetical protein